MRIVAICYSKNLEKFPRIVNSTREAWRFNPLSVLKIFFYFFYFKSQNEVLPLKVIVSRFLNKNPKPFCPRKRYKYMCLGINGHAYKETTLLEPHMNARFEKEEDIKCKRTVPLNSQPTIPCSKKSWGGA